MFGIDDVAVAGIGYLGQQQTNAANERIAQKQMDFQERMSNTAHTREVNDLRNAGLNPILSAGGGGASMPSGSAPVMGNSIGAAVNSAMAYKSMKADLESKDKDNELKAAQKKLVDVNTVSAVQDARISKTKADFYDKLSSIGSTTQTGWLMLKNLFDQSLNSAGSMLRESPEYRTTGEARSFGEAYRKYK